MRAEARHQAGRQARHTHKRSASSSHSSATRCASRSSRAATSSVASCAAGGSEVHAGKWQRELSGSPVGGSDGGCLSTYRLVRSRVVSVRNAALLINATPQLAHLHVIPIPVAAQLLR